MAKTIVESMDTKRLIAVASSTSTMLTRLLRGHLVELAIKSQSLLLRNLSVGPFHLAVSWLPLAGFEDFDKSILAFFLLTFFTSPMRILFASSCISLILWIFYWEIPSPIILKLQHLIFFLLLRRFAEKDPGRETPLKSALVWCGAMPLPKISSSGLKIESSSKNHLLLDMWTSVTAVIHLLAVTRAWNFSTSTCLGSGQLHLLSLNAPDLVHEHMLQVLFRADEALSA